MEKEAHDRDQIHWACSAQNDKMLPKQKKSKKNSPQKREAWHARVNAEFDKYRADKRREQQA